MILPERGTARTRVDDWFRARETQPQVYAQVAGNEAIVSMVSLGFGVGVVPRIVLENSPLADKVRAIPMNPALGGYSVGLIAHKRKLASPLISAVLDMSSLLGYQRPGTDLQLCPLEVAKRVSS